MRKNSDREYEENNANNIYTDLAIEAAEGLSGGGKETEGVTVEEEPVANGAATLTWVKVTSAAGAKKIGRPIGNYVTLQSQLLKDGDAESHDEFIKILAGVIGKLKKPAKSKTTLLVGLGNERVTPDSLGPKVIGKSLVTRHIETQMEGLPRPLNPVCAISPGVMGTTGIETADIVKGIAERVKPGLIIAVDALAARATSRINATIQIADTGVSPGGGMGNKRAELSEAALGAPVIAIGVPTVVDAATLVNDTIDLMLDDMIETAPEGGAFYDMLRKLAADEKYEMVKRILDPRVGSMFVTPREVDDVVGRLSNIIANAVNIALHPGITKEDVNRFMY